MPAVALTAWALPRDRARAKEAGFQAHLVKPVDPSTLVSVVGALAVRSGADGPEGDLTSGAQAGSIPHM